MSIKRIPSSFGQFSEIVAIDQPGTWLQIAGQVAFDETGQSVIDGGVEEQTSIIFDQMERHLAKLGATLEHIVKLQAFLIDLSDYEAFSRVRSKRFAETRPASAAVGVADLLLGARIEIDGVAFLPHRS